jgi:uncharacterized protein
MSIHRPRLVWCLAGLLLALALLARADDIKSIHPTGYVTDLANIFNSSTKAEMEALCTELEQKTGAQLAVVTVKSLDGNEIQPYANDLFKQLGIGKKKEDNGVMLLVAPNERKYWTEVGYGLEPIINDARAGDAGRLMVPYFRQGNYSGGVLAGVQQLARYIADAKGVTLTGMPQIHPRAVREPESHIGVFILLAIVLFIVFAGFSRGGGPGGPYPGGGGGSGFGTGLLIGSLLGSLGNNDRGGWSGSGGGGWGGSSGGFGGGGDSGGGGFGGFGGGESGGGGAGGSW